MATYYMFRPKDNYMIVLGETSFDKFYTDDGWYIFNSMVEHDDPALNNFVVRRDDSKEELSFDQFLTEIENFSILT